MKIVHDQLPTGERRLRQAAVPDESLSLCPCCCHATETAAHLFQCAHNSQRGHHLLQLKSAIRTCDIHPVRYLLWAGMDHWLSHGDDALFHPPLDDFPPHFHPHLQGALDTQRAFGWGNAVKGLFSLRWRHISTLDMHHASRINNSQGDLRMISIIHATHELTYHTWLSRNSDLHQRDDAELARIRSSESAEIRHYHSSPHLLAMANRHYCSRSLDPLLLGSVSTRRCWLRRIKISVAAHERDGSRPSWITSFFSPTSA